MPHDPRLSGPRAGGTLLQRVVATVFAIIAAVVALTFSVFIVAIVLVAGLMIWAYFAWKTRALRQAMREAAAPRAPGRDSADPARGGGRIIDGEVIRAPPDTPPR